MSDWSIFADGSDGHPLGTARRIAIAGRHVLLGRPTLSSWAEGRIVCIPDPLAEPNLPLPWIGVTIGAQGWAINTNKELVDTLTLTIVPVYEETRHIVEDTEPTITSVIHEIDRAIFGNYYLQVPYFGNADLVERIEDVATVTYEGLVDGIDIVRQRIAREFIYSYTIDSATGAPT